MNDHHDPDGTGRSPYDVPSMCSDALDTICRNLHAEGGMLILLRGPIGVCASQFAETETAEASRRLMIRSLRNAADQLESMLPTDA